MFAGRARWQVALFGSAAQTSRHHPGGAATPPMPVLERKETVMLLAIFAVLVVVWLLGWGAFHVAGGLIHLLLIVAVVFLVLHFVRRRRV
jgi:hypothetical protein